LGDIGGYYVTSACQVLSTCNFHRDEDDRNVFATKEQAEASLALAQLSQLMKVYNDGWVADWSDGEGKHCVWFFKNEIATDCSYNLSSFLAFKDAKTRDLFLENFRELILTAKPLLG
jgi:translation initiation factor 2 beta subunit (eIF-2beta)/eIF-5